MRCWLLCLLLIAPLFAPAQSSVPDLPAAPLPSTASFSLATAATNPGSSQSHASPPNQKQPLINPATAILPITRTDAERLALKNTAPTAILSHRFWQSHYGDSRSVVGNTLTLNGQ